LPSSLATRCCEGGKVPSEYALAWAPSVAGVAHILTPLAVLTARPIVAPRRTWPCPHDRDSDAHFFFSASMLTTKLRTVVIKVRTILTTSPHSLNTLLPASRL